MSRLRWPDSTNSVSDVPGTIHFPQSLNPQTQTNKIHKIKHLQIQRLPSGRLCDPHEL